MASDVCVRHARAERRRRGRRSYAMGLGQLSASLGGAGEAVEAAQRESCAGRRHEGLSTARDRKHVKEGNGASRRARRG